MLFLKEITIPFVGDKAGKTSSDTYQYPFGYIFGTNDFTGAASTKQEYYGSSISSTTSTTFYIPSSLKKVTVTGGDILRGAFERCNNLTTVILGDNVTSIGKDAFENCESLTTVVIGNGVKIIDNGAFYKCNALNSVSMGNSVEFIGSSAFAYCRSLIKIIIPASVNYIALQAFYNCSSLTDVTFEDTTTWYDTLVISYWEDRINGSAIKMVDSAQHATYLKLSNTYYMYKK